MEGLLLWLRCLGVQWLCSKACCRTAPRLRLLLWLGCSPPVPSLTQTPVLCPSPTSTNRQAIRRAQQHHSLSAADLEGGAATDEEDAELGVRLHPSYPASLEREGFVGGGGSSAGSSHHNNSSSGNGYSSLARPSSPEFELRVVGASSSADGAAAAATARDKARLLGGSGGLERSTLLTLTAASGSGSLHLPGLSGGLGGASATRTTSAKLKTSPKASMDRLDADSLQRRYSAAAEGGSGGGEDGTDPGTAAAVARAVRRHPSSGGESML